MNRFAASPGWDNWMITAYFFLGGLAAGCSFLAALLELAGTEEDAPAARLGHYLSVALVPLCGLLLVADLHRPERFWHMLVQSERFPLPVFKPWSPMSLGSWILLLFGGCSFLALLTALAADGKLRGGPARLVVRAAAGPAGAALRVALVVAALFFGGYTGALLTATNQPVWSDTTLLSGLFLASGISSGGAALLLAGRMARRLREETRGRIESAERGALGVEALFLLLFLGTLGPARGALFGTWSGPALLVGAGGFGLLVPLLIRARSRPAMGAVAAVLVLAGGLLLRAAVLGSAPAVLQQVSR